jgi:tryptophan synthase alpha chain
MNTSPFHQSHKQISIFITAGFPQPDSLPEQLLYLQEKGVDFIEIGIPFSDPMADGPVIQHTSSVALSNGMNLHVLFRQLEAVRNQIHVPLVLMGYLNPILQYGLEAFLDQCAKLNIASLILPDLSLELYENRYHKTFEQYGIPLTFLITPHTPDERVTKIARMCAGSFVYLVGQNSITGGNYDIGKSLQQRYSELKSLCGETPLFLGFGIDSKDKKKQAWISCDGVIIGTAYLKALENHQEEVFLTQMGIQFHPKVHH